MFSGCKENRYKFAKILTKQSFYDVEDCSCGKQVFKYQDTTKNIFIAKCSYVGNEYDTKNKKWIKAKKQPCDTFYVYHGTRPIFEEIKNCIVSNKKFIDPHKNLEEVLRSLFRFLLVSTHTTTLQEIDLLVKNKLKKEPRKIYYFPTVGHYMRESHRESYIDYRDRILSHPIIDLSIKIYKPKITFNNLPTIKKIEPVKIKSDFIDVSDIENTSDNDSDNDSDQESNSDSDNRGNSDYESIKNEYNDHEDPDDLDDLDDLEDPEDLYTDDFEDAGDAGDFEDNYN